MDSITNAINAHVEQEVAALKVSLAKARSAAVMWRKRCDAMEIRALSAEADYGCEKAEYDDMTKEWAELEEKLRARAEKAETALAESVKKVDVAYQRGVDDGLALAKVAAEAEKDERMPKIVTEEPKKPEVMTYKATDVYRNKNDVSQLGFDKNKSYDEMLELAVKNKCCVMVKDGSGKWYLKGQDMDFETVKQKVEDATKNVVPRHKNVTLYLIKL